MKSRREFLKHTALLGGATGLGLTAEAAENLIPENLYESEGISIAKPDGRNHYQPLEEVTVEISTQAKGIRVSDAMGRVYLQASDVSNLRFPVAGALGFHTITVTDKKGRALDSATFPVDCHTSLHEETGEYDKFFKILYETLHGSRYSSGKVVRFNGKYYRYYSSWFQDHVYVAEGMKYFAEEMKTGIDLYADGQRNDGLIWDNYKHPYPELQSFWEYRFDYGGFTYRPEDERSTAIFVRIPVENIGEHTFLEGLYFAWKATGDDEWMRTKLDNALKAVEFATSSPWYWNPEKQLLKRPFSIDRWDFQSDFDAEITGKDFMGADLDRTRYGIMFGDNICMANGCQWLAEMLEVAGRNDEAQQMRQLSDGLWKRTNELSWKGDFYRHWVPVENQQEVPFEVDTTEQVTLSNAMALLRGLDHEKAVKVIETYQRIQKEMPETSPGEWYLCYPPFEKGWHIGKWEYMNGGISPIVAGDLALGAFNHGYEAYGTDILKRLHQLANRSGHFLDGCYKGKMPEAPERSFTILNLAPHATTSLQAGAFEEAKGWIGGEKADFRNLPTGSQTFEGIPFHILPPDINQHKSCMVVSNREGYSEKVQVPVNQKAKSLYLLHTSDTADLAGTLYLHYTDGTVHSRYIQKGKEIGHYWFPTMEEIKKGIPATVVAWRGPSKVVKEVGVYAFGMNNPHPDKTLAHLTFYNPMASNWAVMGITLSSGPHFFEPPITSTIPAHWAAAHVFKALMEGLAGVVSTGKAFEKATLKPRWELAGSAQAEVTAKYAPSKTYLSYHYQKLDDHTYEVTFTTNGEETAVELMVPEGKTAQQLLVDGEAVRLEMKKMENSQYACTTVFGIGVKQVRLVVG